MAKQTKERKPVIDLTAERVANIEKLGYDLVPLSVLKQPPDEVYPRLAIDTDVVEQYRENWESYQNSPIQAELSNGYIIDGMHRYSACKEIGEIQAKANNEEFDPSKTMIRVVWIDTPSSAAEFMLDGAIRNAKHGLSLNNDDRKKCVLWLNRNGRPRRGITEWQEDIANKLGVAPRTLRDWINQDVADEKALREAKIRTYLTKNDELPNDSKDRLSLRQIGDLVGTTQNVVRNVRAKMLKEAKSDAARPQTDKRDPGNVAQPPIDGHNVVAERGPTGDIDFEVSPLDRDHPIYTDEDARVRRAAMMALDEDQADSVYHDWCITVALADQTNVNEIKKTLEKNPDNEPLQELAKELDEKSKQSWAFVNELCEARQALKTNLQKWVARQARALKREMTIEQEIGGGQNPHETQRVHTAMQNAPLGDEVELIKKSGDFSIYRNPLAPDGYVVGPSDTTKHLRYFYPVVGKDSLKKAEIMLKGFVDNPRAYDEYVQTVVNRPLPNLLKGDHPGKGWLPGHEGDDDAGGGGETGGTTQALDPKSGEMGATKPRVLTVDEHFQRLDDMFGAFDGATKVYKLDRVRNIVAAHIIYMMERDGNLELGDLHEMYNNTLNELLDAQVENVIPEQNDDDEVELGEEDIF